MTNIGISHWRVVRRSSLASFTSRSTSKGGGKDTWPSQCTGRRRSTSINFQPNDLWFLESLEVAYPCFVRLLPDISLAGELHRRLCLWVQSTISRLLRKNVGFNIMISKNSYCKCMQHNHLQATRQISFTMILTVLHHLLGWKSRILSKSLFWLPK